MSRLEAAIAVTRFGMGARPGEIAAATPDPRGWLKAQIRPEAAMLPAGDLKSTQQIFAERSYDRGGMASPPFGSPDANEMRAGQQQLQRERQQQIQRESRESLASEVQARSRQGAVSSHSFAERWARFWANHFTVAARSAPLVGLVGPYEREAIRPHVFGSFADLLASAVFHPAMLIYLDANRSIGPSTRVAQRRDAGLNENLAREILELHTLGVGSGYTQGDIIEFAKALTGWTVGGGPQAGRGDVVAESGRAIFRSQLHEPGSRVLLGQSYDGAPRTQASRMLNDLARHPATARRVAYKIARHFIADDPPPAAVAQLERTFVQSDGDLSLLATALIDLDEAWSPEARKFKSPDDLLVSAARATGQQAAYGRDLRAAYQSLAQPPFGAPAPSGWPDDAASWSGGDAMIKRLEWANATSRRLARALSPTELLDVTLGELATKRTRDLVARAETAEQGVTLALMSPEFQRR